MSNTRSTPAPRTPNRKNTFNLDTLEKDAEAPKPLPVILGGEEFVFGDIDDADWWTELTQMEGEEDIEGQLQLMLGEEQWERFKKHPLPGWKLRALYKQLDEHFGFTKRMGDEGEGDASPTS